MPQISTKDFGILSLTKNAKINNNMTGYRLVSRCVISTPLDVQRVYRFRTLHIAPKMSSFSFKYVIIAS